MTAARLSATATALLVAVYVLALSTGAIRGLERSVLVENPSALHDLFGALVIVIVNPVTVTLAGLAAMCHASRADGMRAAGGVAIMLVGPILTAQGLKAGLGTLDPFGAEARRALGRAFFPSGHAAAAMAVGLIVIRAAAPQRGRTVALLAGLAVGAYGILLFTSDNHHPLDVVGGLLLAVAWSVALVALWPVRHAGQPTRRPRLRPTIRGPVPRRAAIAAAETAVAALALQLTDLRPWRPLMFMSAVIISLAAFALVLAFERTLIATTPRLQR